MTENLNTEPEQVPTPHYPAAGPPLYQAPTEFNMPRQPAPMGPKSKSRKQFILPAALLVGGLLIGGGIGYANRPAPVVEVQTKTETKSVTPATCIDALTQADLLLLNDADMVGYMSDALKAAGSFNTAGIQAASASMAPVNARQKDLLPKYTSAKQSCQASR
ncbi:hypothetical protein [Arthrobacter sp. fls2-241-R2A-200]|uniref:hypothetical protein n=1 Tax=Arthrobacter sp. fls2-241-R2A-200 TaxID=3040281 RepID=UPI00254CA94A|nr:hypothetical protein [Arthrobacter sp. fls2-241-R2A-200]